MMAKNIYLMQSQFIQFFSMILFISVTIYFCISVFESKVNTRTMWQLCKSVRFQSPWGKRMTALVSYPGSGNTWLRDLLQKSTGIATGSMYVDLSLLQQGFLGESVSDGRVLVVKTHMTADVTKFQAAVVLIRNPRDTLMAEFNRVVTDSHVGIAPLSFKKQRGFVRFFKDMLPEWEKLYRVWITLFTGPLHVVLYEDLLNGTGKTLRGVLDFLGQDVSAEDVNCAVRREGFFRRTHFNDSTFDPFSPWMYKELNGAMNRIINLVQTRRNIESNRRTIGAVWRLIFLEGFLE